MADQNSQAPEDVGAPIAYLVLQPGTPVYDRSGAAVGTVEHVLADDRQDVFHGLILRTGKGHRYAPGDQIDGMFEHAVIVAVPAGELPEPSADPAAQAVENDSLRHELRRAWDWLVEPK
jgi:uncharacterized protein YrrD